MDCSLPGTSVHRIFQARILEWVAMHSSRYLPDTGIEYTTLMTPALAGGFINTSGLYSSIKWIIEWITIILEKEMSLWWLR